MKKEPLENEETQENLTNGGKSNPTPPEPEKPVDVWIEDESKDLTQNILNSLNNSTLPTSIKKMLLIDLVSKVINTYDQTIAAQREAYNKQCQEG